MNHPAVSGSPSEKTIQAPQKKRYWRDLDGLLLLDKPTGMTSNAALQRVRRLFGARKAGHTGSLDPLASGMLPVCFGQGTKVCAYLLESDKTYEVRARFGAQTDTADADGTVIAESEVKAVAQNDLEQAIRQFVGDIRQVPPMYSALKKDGRRLYELARQGLTVDRPSRPVTIRSIELIEYDPVEPLLRVSCSKGTYIRTLVEDIAQAAGTLGHVAVLRRTSVEPFAGLPMATMEVLEAAGEADEEALERFLLPVDAALKEFGAVNLSSEQTRFVRQGNPVQMAGSRATGMYRIYGDEGDFIGLGEVLADSRLAPKRLFAAPPQPAGEEPQK